MELKTLKFKVRYIRLTIQQSQ